jgi:hypothetical protein
MFLCAINPLPHFSLVLQGLDKMPLPEFKDDHVGTKLFVYVVGKDDPLRAVHEFLLRNMDPHMVEVLTGQGKSVVLALTSIVLAFFNFRVDCACYSEYLSARDRVEFKNVCHVNMHPDINTHSHTTAASLFASFKCNCALQVFEFFDVSDFIAYSTFNTLCERTINELGEVRGAVLQLVNPGQVVSTSQSTAKLSTNVDTLRKKVALIDEVDVFFSKSFYGQVTTLLSSYVLSIAFFLFSFLSLCHLLIHLQLFTGIYTSCSCATFMHFCFD